MFSNIFDFRPASVYEAFQYLIAIISVVNIVECPTCRF